MNTRVTSMWLRVTKEGWRWLLFCCRVEVSTDHRPWQRVGSGDGECYCTDEVNPNMQRGWPQRLAWTWSSAFTYSSYCQRISYVVVVLTPLLSLPRNSNGVCLSAHHMCVWKWNAKEGHKRRMIWKDNIYKITFFILQTVGCCWFLIIWSGCMWTIYKHPERQTRHCITQTMAVFS